MSKESREAIKNLKYAEDRAEAHTVVIQRNPDKYSDSIELAMLMEIACERRALCIIARKLSEQRVG